MKKILALMLALIMVLSLAACGGNDTKESDSDKTSSNAEQSDTAKGTEQAPQEKVDVPEGLVGTWYLLPIAFYNAAMSAPTADSTKDLITYDNATTEFTVSDNGTVNIDGKEYYLNNSSGEKYENDDCGTFDEKFIFTIGEVQYRIYLNTDSNNSEYVVFEPFGNLVYQYVPIYSKTKYTEKTAEVTLDNWQDFFEVKFNDKFGTNKNEWGDVAGFYGGGLILAQKDNVKITIIQKDRIAYKCTITETALAHFNKTTEECTLSDTSAESNETFERESFLYEGSSSDPTDHPLNLGGAVGTFNDVKDAGNEFTARVATKGDLEVTRIMGTITYLTTE